MTGATLRHIDLTRTYAGANSADVARLARLYVDIGPAQWSSVLDADARGDRVAVARGLHRLRGSLAVLGARSALDTATRIEAQCEADSGYSASEALNELGSVLEGVMDEARQLSGNVGFDLHSNEASQRWQR